MTLMRLGAVVAGFTLLALNPTVGPATADSPDAASGQTDFIVSGQSGNAAVSDDMPNASDASSTGPALTYHEQGACALGGSTTCAEPLTCEGGQTVTYWWYTNPTGATVSQGFSCPGAAPEIAAAPPQVTPGMVQRALERVRLPEPDLSVQPPGGRTLINFETNFFTAAEPFTETVTLLGRRVDLDISPSQFRWAFGDGEGLTTTEPGAPYPDLELTHTYLEQGQVRPQVTTVYTADYRVDGGPWQPVPGSVDITSDPVDLTVTEVTNQLVDYR